MFLQEDVDLVPEKVIITVTSLQLIDWATRSSSSKERLLVFYRLCDR